jgi:ABC-type multidrug transport system fused ATPase/permease subunit
MRSPTAHVPGAPDHRSATRFLLWTARCQRSTIAVGMVWGTLWMVSQALMPAALGRAIDAGVTGRDLTALLLWSAVLLGLGGVQAVMGVLRHRVAVYNWLSAAYRTVRLVSGQATRLGGTLPKRLSTGEVIAVGVADISHLGGALEITARGAGAVVAIVMVGAVAFSVAASLGLLVLVGVPLMALVVGILLRPLHRRQRRLRDRQGELMTRAGDIVAGLRVLRGIGGEELFAGRYRGESQRVRRAGVEVAKVESLLEGLKILLPGLLIAFVTWLGARYALAGVITPGELVAFYGYAVFLITPLRTLTEAADKITKGHVAARRVVRLLDLRPEIGDPARPPAAPADAAASAVSGPALAVPPGPVRLRDARSGAEMPPGRVTALAAASPAEAERLADRLGRYRDADVTWNDVPLRDLPLEVVRRRVVVARNDDRLFTGPLRQELDPAGDAGDERISAALTAACAGDIVDAQQGGIDAWVAEGGREFSGGQQQRLRLARALVADPEVLVLVEPTSAVDAHTEARIAERLVAARAGRTTLVCTTSPLVLDRAHHVIYLEDDKVLAEGTHRELLDAEPRYAATVTREEDGPVRSGRAHTMRRTP